MFKALQNWKERRKHRKDLLEETRLFTESLEETIELIQQLRNSIPACDDPECPSNYNIGSNDFE